MNQRIKSLSLGVKIVLFLLSIVAPYLFWDIIYQGTLIEYSYTNPWDAMVFLTISWFAFWILVWIILWLRDSARSR